MINNKRSTLTIKPRKLADLPYPQWESSLRMVAHRIADLTEHYDNVTSGEEGAQRGSEVYGFVMVETTQGVTWKRWQKALRAVADILKGQKVWLIPWAEQAPVISLGDDCASGDELFERLVSNLNKVSRQSVGVGRLANPRAALATYVRTVRRRRAGIRPAVFIFTMGKWLPDVVDSMIRLEYKPTWLIGADDHGYYDTAIVEKNIRRLDSRAGARVPSPPRILYVE